MPATGRPTATPTSKATESIPLGQTKAQMATIYAYVLQKLTDEWVHLKRLSVLGDIDANRVFERSAPPWTSPTYLNGWVNYLTGNAPVGYRRIGGRIFLRGIMKSGTMNTTAFTLPVSYRPPFIFDFAVTSNLAFGQVNIAPSGAVTPVAGSNAWVSLDSISFAVN